MSICGARAQEAVELLPGEHVYEVVVEVEAPELWWPVGHGEQTLHELVVEVVSPDARERRVAPIGFRRVEVNQDSHPDGGRFFKLRVNNRPIFCKGGNLVPDQIPARTDRAHYDSLIALALEANFNFLRVWGGGFYEDDHFYELCDRCGSFQFLAGLHVRRPNSGHRSASPR